MDENDSWKGACLQLQDEVEAARARVVRELGELVEEPELLKELETAELTVKWAYQ